MARANAVQKIWPLEGYLLKQRIHAGLPIADLSVASQRVAAIPERVTVGAIDAETKIEIVRAAAKAVLLSASSGMGSESWKEVAVGVVEALVAAVEKAP